MARIIITADAKNIEQIAEEIEGFVFDYYDERPVMTLEFERD